MKFISSLLLATILIFVGSTPSAQNRDEKAAPPALVKFPVWVEQGSGTYWKEGKRQGFKVFVDNQETSLKSFQGPQNSTIVLVIFDTVADLARVDMARQALGAKIRKFERNYWVGLLRAQDGLSVLQEPTADRDAISDKIKQIQVSGRAGLLDTLEPAASLASGILQKAGIRICILYVTDSGIANYRADYLNPVINSSAPGALSRRFSDRAVQERLSRMADLVAPFRIPIFILHLEYRTDTLNLAYQSGLERIAAATGGATLICRTNDEIEPGLEKLLTQIKSSYFLGIEKPQAAKPSVKLRVEASDAEGNPLDRVIYTGQIILPKD